MEQPLRQQYIFDLSGAKFKTRCEILTMQRQWNTYERIENYNDIVYQRLEKGYRDRLYYQFKNNEELADYRNGMQLHNLRYPGTCFESISERPMPDVAVITKAPNWSPGIERNLLYSTSMTAAELTAQQSDLAIYTHVSTFNAKHVFKYNFVSDEERLGYHRAERRVLLTQGVIL